MALFHWASFEAWHGKEKVREARLKPWQNWAGSHEQRGLGELLLPSHLS